MGISKKSVKRLTADETIRTVTAPDWASRLLIRNADPTTDIMFNFDGSSTDFYTLKPGQELPAPIPLLKDEEFHYTTGTGNPSAILESIIWG